MWVGVSKEVLMRRGIKSGGHAPLVLCPLVSVNSIWDGCLKNAFWSDGLRLLRCHTC